MQIYAKSCREVVMLNVPQTRQQKLLARLANGDELIAQELAVEFEVSLDTIRRDIIALEQRGEVQRVRGGAVSAAPPSPPMQYRTSNQNPAVAAIASRTLREIEGASTLLLDGGTTLLAVAERLQPKPGLLVMTPSPWIAVACQKNGVEVFMLGGKLSPSGGINVGDAALLATTDVHVDIAVLGVCGIDPAFGLSADDLHEAQLKLAMTRASARTIALASREKIGRRARYRAVAPEYLDCLITDADASAVMDFNQDGMEIIHA
ncbi:hypothetical protein CUR86_08550 [Salinicola acroporae]|uniref:HTH deoR-type domain-containing protein n=2 Tax=Salinicola acroporae TaxID=1541440 RepID=A0ABT6I4V4_9GAMM|nr:hypothetical protein [Salinicola acroporae]